MRHHELQSIRGITISRPIAYFYMKNREQRVLVRADEVIK